MSYNQSKPISLSVNPELLEKFDKILQEKGAKRSPVIKKFIELYVNAHIKSEGNKEVENNG